MQDQNPIIGAIAQEAALNPPDTDEGKQLLSDISGAEQQVNINKASEYYNLVENLDSAKANQIGQQILKGFKADDESRSEWLDLHTFWLRLYMQTDYAISAQDGRDWGATESVPLLTEACDQFGSRTYKAFFPNEQFISAVILRHTKDPGERQELQDRADRIGRHMSWQLGVQNKDYKRNKRALFLATAVHGSFFTKTFFDAQKKIIRIDNVRPTDFVVNYTVGPKRIDELRRKSHIIHTTVGETEGLVQKGYLIKAARADYGSSETQYDIAVNESQGLTDSDNAIKRDVAATLIEQQFYLDIDDSGQFLPYLGAIDHTGSLLRLTIDYEADENGNPTNDYEQIQYYTHYKFMENPDGFYGLGLGAKIGDLNSAVSIGMRQMLDAATLANDGNNSGYISNRLCMDGEEEVELTLGKLKKVPDSVDDITKGILLMHFPGPNDSQMKLIQWLDATAQRMAGTTEALTGSIEKNMQPTTVLAQIEQGLEMFSSVQMGLADDFGDELQKIYKLNQKHLPLVEYFSVNEAPEAVTRADYQDDMAIQPIFDPKFSTQMQKIARVQAEAQIVMANPFLAQNPDTLMTLTRRGLEAMDAPDIDSLLPPPPPPPANIDDQLAENMLFLMPQHPPFDVFPDQHHAEHLQEIEKFVATHGTKLLPQQQQEVVNHKQKHEAFLYGQQTGQIPPSQPRGNPQLGARQSNAISPQGADPQVSPLQGFVANPLLGAGLPSQPSGGHA